MSRRKQAGLAAARAEGSGGSGGAPRAQVKRKRGDEGLGLIPPAWPGRVDSIKLLPEREWNRGTRAQKLPRPAPPQPRAGSDAARRLGTAIKAGEERGTKGARQRRGFKGLRASPGVPLRPRGAIGARSRRGD